MWCGLQAGRSRDAAAAFGASICIVAALLGGCGGSSASSTENPKRTSTYHPLAPPKTQPSVTHAFPRVGTTQRVNAGGTTLSVTIERLLDPLDGSRAALLPHTRAVGVVAAIRDDGPGAYDSSSTGDFSVVPSSGTATPVFTPAGACQTSLRDWDNEIAPGEERSGCIAFALGTGAKIVQVRFSPHAHAAHRATWSASR